MRILRIALAFLMAVSAVGAFLIHRHPGSGGVEWIFQRYGIQDSDRLAEIASDALWNGKIQGPDGAIANFQQALLGEVSSPYRWCDLAEAYLEGGDEQRARQCLERAVELGPLVPPILLRAANGFFRLGDEQRALVNGARVLDVTPAYDLLVFTTYSRMEVSVERVLGDGLPAGNARAARSFLRHLLKDGLLDEARRAWLWSGSRGFIDGRLADEYGAALMERHMHDEAVAALVTYLGADRGEYRRPNLVFNGGFERDPLGPSFDWTLHGHPQVRVGRDSNRAWTGGASLRIQFSGQANIAYNHVRQVIPLEPGFYVFEAHIRTRELTTDRGVGFRMRDPENEGRLFVTTRSISGSTEWELVREEFRVQSPTRLLELAVVRDPSMKFDNLVRGEAWIDGVRLVRRTEGSPALRDSGLNNK